MRERERREGHNPLPLVMLPGTLCDARVFAPLLHTLGELAPDLDAQVCLTGQSGSLQEAAEEVLARSPEHFALLGFSLGGLVALETALHSPERIHALILISTTPLPVPPERHATRRAALDHVESIGIARYVHEQLWPQYGGTEGHVTTTLSLLQEMALSLGQATFARQTEMALQRKDYCPRLSAIRCPALAICGDADQFCPPATQRALTAGLATATTVTIPGAGHLALLERADEVAIAVAAWFNTLKP